MTTALVKRISKLEKARPAPLQVLVEDIANTLGLVRLKELLELDNGRAFLREYWQIKQARLSKQELERLEISFRRALSFGHHDSET